jgi:hypothetical protein
MIFGVLFCVFVEDAAVQRSHALFQQIYWRFTGVDILFDPALLHTLDQLSVYHFEVNPTSRMQ